MESTTMKKTTFYHFLENNGLDPCLTRREVVDIRSNTPRLSIFCPCGFSKILTNNDVTSCVGALELSAIDVYDHIFKHFDDTIVLRIVIDREQVPIVMWDVDTLSEHTLLLKRWEHGEKFLIHCGWFENFVERRRLKEGMIIALYWDVRAKSLNFSVKNC